MQQPSYPVVKGGAPGPTPPSPTPPSPTPPTKTHYEKPPCQADETEAQIQGLDGSLCAPKCNGSTCPTDKPSCRASPLRAPGPVWRPLLRADVLPGQRVPGGRQVRQAERPLRRLLLPGLQADGLGRHDEAGVRGERDGGDACVRARL